MSNDTQLEWIYRPGDYFEAPREYREDGYKVLIEAGKVIITLDGSPNPVPDPLLDKIGRRLEAEFAVRQLHVHQPYDLDGPRTYLYDGGRKAVLVTLAASVKTTCHPVDFEIRNTATGEVVRDTKQERIGLHAAELESLAPKAARSEVLRGLLASYGAAVKDPADELVHLYEIRDALAKYLGSDKDVQKHLGIRKSKWDVLGIMANTEPFYEGRHRGTHPTRRPATQEELDRARHAARDLILAFARTL